jgi:acetyl/propionyl-CoA carboxylase alpha subunit
MRAMADKAEARRRMRDAGVAVLPGLRRRRAGRGDAARRGGRLGYPLMVKAVAGGGGRGMRLVASEGELDAALVSAAAEAASASGDGRLLLERALAAARHVEIQVFADSFGRWSTSASAIARCSGATRR